MKLTAIILFVACMQVSATAFSQKINLSDHQTPLAKVLGQIAQQSGYSLFYDKELIGASAQVDVQVSNASVEQALEAALKNLPLNWSIVDQTIVIRQKQVSAMEALKNQIKAELAQVTVTGKVTDELGNPMVGVTVKQKSNPGNVTATDAKGNFALTLPDDNATVSFSYVGYDPREIAAKDLPKGVVITLKPNETNLHEVTIFKGYYSEKQALSTGNVAVVSAKTIEEQPVSDPILALEGRVPGLLIAQTNGYPGANQLVRLRGQNSIANGSDPLYIIDGVPFTSLSLSNNFAPGGIAGRGNVYSGINTTSGLSPFNSLNPSDIENIEVLKDADATAIYGSRGANGVILITTKKGKVGTVAVNMDLSQGIGQLARTLDLLNTQQYLQIEHHAFANDHLNFPSIAASPNDPNYSVNGFWDTTRNTNWQKILLNNIAHYTNAQASISGGTQNTQFYVGTGFNRQTTVYPNTHFADVKGTVNFNINHSSADQRFSLQLSGGFSYDDNTLPGTNLVQTAIAMPPDAPGLFMQNGALNWQLYNGTATWANPLATFNSTSELISKVLTANAKLSYRITPGLKIQTSLGYTDESGNTSNQTPSTAVAPPNNLLPTSRINNFGPSEFANWIIEPQLTYDRNIARGHLNIVLGGTWQQSNTTEIGYTSTGYNSDALIANPLNASTLKLSGYSTTLYRYQGIYGRVGYTWQDKYLLNLTANRDGSSRFGPATQWGDFGAIGAGWVFSKENFAAKEMPWLSFGKLRASYGITGNDQITDYQYLSTYTTDASTYQNSTGLKPTRLANPYYGWEIDKKLEGGLELGFLKDRIMFTAAYYRNRTGNQLIGYSLPFISGFTTIQENLPAIIQNAGAEFSLHTVNLVKGAFSWTTDVNLSIPTNKLVSYPGLSSSSLKNTYMIGQSLFMKEYFTGTKVNPANGNYEWLAANGSYTENPINPADLRATQPLTAKYYGALGNSFRYKAFQLDVFFEFRKQFAYNYWYNTAEIGYPGINYPTAILGNTWTAPGQQSKYGRLSSNALADPNYNNYNSDFAIGDASFIRLKTVAFSWSLPKRWQEAAHLQNTRLYVNAQNLLTFTNYLGLDPESGAVGLPPLRMIAIGLHTSL